MSWSFQQVVHVFFFFIYIQELLGSSLSRNNHRPSAVMLYQNPNNLLSLFFRNDHHLSHIWPGYKWANYSLPEVRPLTLIPNKYRDIFFLPKSPFTIFHSKTKKRGLWNGLIVHVADGRSTLTLAGCASWSESCSVAIIPTLVPCNGKNTAANKSNQTIRLSVITLLNRDIQDPLICLPNQFYTAKYHWVLAVKAMLSWGVPYVESRNRVKILIWKSHETVIWNM